ncbi:hypothetical protein ma796 [Moumouvirus australiensis]|uniref:Uncharacterized protein n=1 Tax=Moumouvirus australiensis TaxID=2109587 RepID=A0A2P1EMS9_9VIRU|nr:hypothetical protein QKC55_gp108 [Moumouvirus australiensis]AVL95183.1 hypothetical protein ma796 [Moumouvirus australiensis]
MLSNIIVGISNLPAYYAIKLSFNNGDYLTSAALSFVFSASFVSHLAENHKHGMSGIGFSSRTSYILNRFGYLYYSKYGTNFNVLVENQTLIYFGLLSFLLLRISEYDKYNPKLKYIYIVSHCLWHISIFTLIYHFLDKIIY